MYQNNYVPTNLYNQNQPNNDRCFAPFLVGGLAGTALGYGIANNNQNCNKPCCINPIPYYYQIPYPTYYSTNYYY